MFGEILAWVDKNVNLAPKRKDWQAPLFRFHFKNLPPDFKNGATRDSFLPSDERR